MSCLKSTAPSTKTAPTINQSQQEGLSATIDWAKVALENVPAGQQYQGQLTADTPQFFEDTYNQYTQNRFGEDSDAATRDLINAVPGYTFDAESEASRWQDTFANPVMNAWRDAVLPTLREEINRAGPGSLYSRGTSDYVSIQANRFYGQNVVPTLYSSIQAGQQRAFTSKENALGRQPDALNIPYQQVAQDLSIGQIYKSDQQDRLTVDYNEYIRATDPCKYAQLLAGVSTVGTQQTVVKPGMDNPYLSGVGAGIGAYAGASG